MVEDPDIHPPPNDQSDVDRFAALADGSVAALGLSSSAVDALEQALEVKTVRDLADNRYVRRAQAIVNLANEKEPVIGSACLASADCELVGQRA